MRVRSACGHPIILRKCVAFSQVAEVAVVGHDERSRNPYDNAQCESFIKTVKCEEVYLNEYETFQADSWLFPCVKAKSDILS